MKKIQSIIFVFLALIYSTQTLTAKEENILLRISDANKTKTFTRKDLSSYKQFSITQETFWTDGATTFKGPLLKDILTKNAFTGKFLTAIAYNDYKVKIPREDFYSYNVILATHVNGKEITVRSKGPLWLIYPWGNHTELDQKIYYARSIWQLVKATVHD